MLRDRFAEKYHEYMPMVARVLAVIVALLISSLALELVSSEIGYTPVDLMSVSLGQGLAGILKLVVSLQWWRWAFTLAVVLAVDAAALHYFTKLRGRELAVSLAQTAVLVTYVSVMLIMPGGSQPQEVTLRFGIMLLALAAACTFEPMHAFVFWCFAAGSLLSSMYMADVLAGIPMSAYTVSDSRLGALFIFLSFASTGAFALYARRVVRAGRGNRHVFGRLGLAFSSLVIAMLLAGSLLWVISGNEAAMLNQESSFQSFELSYVAARDTASHFTAAQIEAGGPDIVEQLARFAGSMHTLTIVDTERGAAVVSARVVPGETEGSELEATAVSLSATETALIVKATIDDNFLGTPGVGSSIVATSQTAASRPGDPRARFVMVATPWWEGWADNPGAAPADMWGNLVQALFPILFATLLLVVSIALLILERRDRVMASLLFAQERARLGRDAHDRVYNRLTALANGLEARGGGDAQPGGSAHEVRGALRDLQRILGDVDARAAAQSDEAATLFDDLVSDQAERWGMQVALSGREELEGIDPRLAWELQCVVEEALTNAGKHGHARSATVTVSRDGRFLRVVVADDGSGIDVPPGPDGLPAEASGLRGVADRIRTLGGTMTLASGADGATVSVEVPLRKRA